MTKIAIFKGDEHITTYSINLGSLNEHLSIEAFYKEAFKTAIEDKLLTEKDRDKVRFATVKEG